MFAKWIPRRSDPRRDWDTGRTAFAEGDFRRAAVLLESYVRRCPTAAEVAAAREMVVRSRLAAGDREFQCGRIGEAIRHFRRAALILPGYPDVLYRMAWAYYKAGDRPDASRCLAQALRANHGFMLGRALSAILDYGDGRHKEALDAMASYAKVEPRLKVERLRAARNADRAGRFDEALSNLEAMLPCGQNEAHFAMDVGDELARRGRPELALREYRQAVRSEPGYADARFRLAKALFELGEVEDAENQLHHALELNPLYGEARQLLETIRRSAVTTPTEAVIGHPIVES
ncbi:MAG: tetratricopeptide repeat protein [Fimbriimonadaceae bacterium]|nr:tetratricopeptide repeat protein [Fimbriimonadaceae bacterium]